MKQIELVRVGFKNGQNFTAYSFINDDDEVQEVEITGIAQEIINTLGRALYKKSFVDNTNK
jgi:hypothetical protein